MRLYQEIEHIRTEVGIPDYQMCNIFNITDAEYLLFQGGRFKLPTYSIIMFIIEVRRPLTSIEGREREYDNTRRPVACHRPPGGE